MRLGWSAKCCDEGAQHRDDRRALGHRRGAEVDVLVVAAPEGGEGVGQSPRPCPPGPFDRVASTSASMKRAQLLRPRLAAPRPHDVGQQGRASRCRPRRRPPSRGTRRRCGRPSSPPRPRGWTGAGRDQEWLRMPSSVSSHRLSAASETSAPQTAWSNPSGRKIPRASSLTCPPGPWPQSWPRAMASVSATLSRQARAMPVATWATSSAWREPGALVVGGEDEDLGLARQPAEGRRVQDAVPVPLEAGPPRVGLLGRRAPPGPGGPGRPRGRGAASSACLARPTVVPGEGAGPRTVRHVRSPDRRRSGVGVGASDAGPGVPAMVAAQRRLRSLGGRAGDSRSGLAPRAGPGAVT